MPKKSNFFKTFTVFRKSMRTGIKVKKNLLFNVTILNTVSHNNDPPKMADLILY
jgi:hypothetical protein